MQFKVAKLAALGLESTATHHSPNPYTQALALNRRHGLAGVGSESCLQARASKCLEPIQKFPK